VAGPVALHPVELGVLGVIAFLNIVVVGLLAVWQAE
jgi:hypothetical protein